MTFSYDVESIDDEGLNRIRLEIGDTDSSRPLLQDEEIEQIEAEQSSFNARVAKCCRLICSFFSSKPAYHRIEGLAEDWRDAYKRYETLALKFESMSSSGAPWSAAISIADKETYSEDTSLVQPKFTRGMHDYLGD